MCPFFSLGEIFFRFDRRDEDDFPLIYGRMKRVGHCEIRQILARIRPVLPEKAELD